MSAPTQQSAASTPHADAPPASSLPVRPGRFTGTPAASTRALIIAIELGVLADYLMRANAVGLNVTLWCWSLLAAALLVTAASDVVVDRRRIALLAAASFFAAVPAWRDSEMLVFLSGVAVLILLVLSAWTAGSPGIVLAQRALGSYIRAAVTGALHIIIGAAPLLAAEGRARAELRTTYRRPLGAVVRGVVMSIPVVLVLGALLMQADTRYEKLVSGLFRWDTGTIVSHLLLAGAFTWLAGAYLCASLHWERDDVVRPWAIRLGLIEGGMVLGVVNVLFLSFMIVQVQYLFGGTAHVLETAGLTFAEYARQGFFELVAVTTLTLPLMVGITAAVRAESPRERTVQRALTATLVVLLLGLVASALGRMRIYQAEYGWTLPRVHATVFMLWICGTIVWFAATVLRGDARRFAFGAVMSGLAILGLLTTVNPAAMVVRANAARAQSGSSFDAVDAAAMRADALPALLEALPRIETAIDGDGRCALHEAILRVEAPVEGDARVDWRGWNLSRARARAAIERYRTRTTRILGAAPCPLPAAAAAAASPPSSEAAAPPPSGGTR